ERLAISRPKALILDESHYVKNPQAKRTRAVRRLAEQLNPDALKICLTGTPVMNHPDELISQLRIIGRLEEFGSGARFKRRFQDALHVVGADNAEERDRAVQACQGPDGPRLIVCSTRVAGQRITLTRASNVAFLDLEWSPAMHDQAEDRTLRIGQRDAVTAWY